MSMALGLAGGRVLLAPLPAFREGVIPIARVNHAPGMIEKCPGGISTRAIENTGVGRERSERPFFLLHGKVPPPTPPRRRGGESALRFMRGTRVLMLGLCLAGLMLIAKGAWIPAKAAVAQVLLERAFDRSLAAHAPVKAWRWADTAPVARISVPGLGRRQIVLDGGSGEAMAFGPTLLPAGAGAAEEGTTIIAAHRDTHFAFLGELRVGDAIDVEAVSGKRRRYRVARFEVVRWDTFSFRRHSARSTLVLTSCWPFGAQGRGPLRYVVWAVEG